MKMTVDRGEWKWELAETYGILACRMNHMGLEWWIGSCRGKMAGIQENAEKERKRFEAYVNKKLEYAKVEEK